MEGGNDAERRVWASLPAGTREALSRLPSSDLRTLLLALVRDRTKAVTPAEVVRRWRTDRFVRPSDADPRRLAAVEAALWDLLPDDVDGVELSPVAPLGTVSALAPVSPNRIVATTRLTEVVSDLTNALAVEAAVRRRGLGPGAAVHLAACQRQLRAQALGPGMSAHFGLFALVSTARDVGSGRTEAHLALRHLRFWQVVLDALVPDAEPRIELTAFGTGAVAERLADTVLPTVGDGPTRVRTVPDRSRGRGYYSDLAIRIALADGQEEIGDGGLTAWTARLTGDAKERCLVSCVATERLARTADLHRARGSRPATAPGEPGSR